MNKTKEIDVTTTPTAGRPRTKLRKKYRKLKVLHDFIGPDKRRYAHVQCTCGTTKDVLTSALTSGRVQSCGATGCRAGLGVKVDPTYHPRLPEMISRAHLRRAITAITRTKNRSSVAEQARKYNVNVNTMYTIVRNVQRAGGIDEFVRKATS